MGLKSAVSRVLNWLDFTRRLIVNAFFLIILIILVVSLSSSLSSLSVDIEPDSALLIAPSGSIVEKDDIPEPLEIIMRGEFAQATVLSKVIRALEVAADDDRIRLVVLDVSDMGATPIARLHELRVALEAFRESGKSIIATSRNYQQAQFYLASVADEILLQPMGTVLINGLSGYRSFYKEALDKLKVDAHIFKVGAYKSAVEPFTRNDMSPSARENLNAWIQPMWASIRNDMAASRGLNPAVLQEMGDKPDQALARTNGDTTEFALKNGLVDQVMGPYELSEYLSTLGVHVEDNEYRHVDVSRYLAATYQADDIASESSSIGIITAVGTISSQMDSGEDGIHPDVLHDQFEQARSNDDIQAVVLRLDTGGGEVQASELIRLEVEKTVASGKPVVVSMGSLTASGGYWIASAANKILADPLTLTGSIGIFGVLPKAYRSLEAMGIHSDGVGTTTSSGAAHLDRPLPKAAANAIQQAIDHGYHAFVNRVAEGRGLTVLEVKKIAQGRIWLGSQALEHKLVDSLGGLNAAIQQAADLAELEDFRPITISPSEGQFEMLMKQFKLKMLAWLGLGELQAQWQLVQRFTQSFGIYADCMCAVPAD